MRMTVFIAATLLSLCAARPTLAQNWPQFRGPEATGIAASGSVPVEWGPEQHVAWKIKLPGVGWSQPVVWSDKVFVTTAASEAQKKPRPGDWGPGGTLGGLSLLFGSGGKPPEVQYQWKAICLDAASGQIVWEQTAREGRPTNRIHYNNSYATETPATDGERLIAYFGMAGIYCYDLSGKLLWSKDLGTYPMQFDWGTASSPVIYGEAVYVQCDNDQASFLVALDKRSGDELWRMPREERSNWSTPFVWKNNQRTELVTAGGTKMRSYDLATGKLLWEMTGGGRTATTPVGDEELLYVDSYDRTTGNRGVLAAIRAGASGDISLAEGETANEQVAWSVRLNSARVASPLLGGGCLYVLDEMAGIVRCLDAKSGKEHYRQRLPGAAGFTASPWASGASVFCLDQDGQTFVLPAGPEFKVLATNKLDKEMFWSSPAVANNSLLIRSTDHLYCIRQSAPAGEAKR